MSTEATPPPHVPGTPSQDPTPAPEPLPPALPEWATASEPKPKRRPATFFLTRFVLLRLLGLVYGVAFLVAAQQNLALMGHDGLTPIDQPVQELVTAKLQAENPLSRWWDFPTIYQWSPTDQCLQWLAWTGVAISAVVLAGFANSILLCALWFLYLSIVTAAAGTPWYGYGWEFQLLETGFIAIFLCPLFDGQPFSRRPPPVVTIWLYRWFIFRIMLGAGLIKWRGDECWRDLTALIYHYETQPVPNPISRWLHFAPVWFNKGGVLWNHFIELVVPWFLFIPLRVVQNTVGVLLVSFQVILILSGNLSFLNWLTIIPCIACLDDSFWRRVLPRFITQRAEAGVEFPKSVLAPLILSSIFACVVVKYSIPVVENLLSPNQEMNNSYDNLHLVNTYGAFGSISRVRYETVLEGTNDLLPSMVSEWREYPFKVKPGDVMRRPPWISPYHYRLDWQMWIDTQGQRWHPWLPHLVWKLLHNDPVALGLLAGNPFPEGPPRYIQVKVYKYQYAPLGNPQGRFWTREEAGTIILPVSVDSKGFRTQLQSFGYPDAP